MSSEASRKALSLSLGAALAQARHLEGLAGLGSDDSTASERLLDVQEKNPGFLVQIASDGLSLEQKMQLETWLLNLDLAVPMTIYFKRRQSLAPRVTPAVAGASAEGPKKGPFGVKFRLKPIAGVKKIIAISSGKGGVGKSTVSVNLAAGLALQGSRVGLLDADLYGPSIPLMMGLHGPMPISADQKMIPLEGFGVKVVSFGFMTDPYNPVIWRGPMLSKALEQLFYQTEWGELDYLLIDLPPGTGDVQLTMIESLPLAGGIVVSTPQAVALLDAHKGLSMFEKLDVPVLGLVENMSHFQCGACGHVDDIFGQEQIEEFARSRRTPILARIPLHRRIREASDSGVPLIHSDPAFAQYYMSLVEAVMEMELSPKATGDQEMPAVSP